jgi:cyanate lyase
MTENTDEEEFDEDQSELAKEFKALCEDVQKKISAKLAEASKALDEATAIAEEYGVPFDASISPLHNYYVPGSLSESKFKDLDVEEVCEISGVYGEYIEDMFRSKYGGWVHSAVC